MSDTCSTATANYLLHGINDSHEELGGRFPHGFGPAVTEPIRLHVPAKRYLCASRRDYWPGLSPASKAAAWNCKAARC